MKNEQEKLADIIHAEGESQAAKLLADAVKKHGDALIQLRKLQAYREIAETLADTTRVTYIPSSKGNLFNFKMN